MTRRRLALGAWALFTLLAAIGFVWSGRSALTVRVVVDGTRLVGSVGGAESVYETAEVGAGRVGLYLGGHGASRLSSTLAAGSPPERGLVGAIDLARALDADVAWAEDVAVAAGDSAWPIADWAPSPAARWLRLPWGGWTTATGGYLLSGEVPGTQATVVATVRRDADLAGILVRGGPAGEGYLFLFRPVHQDAMWWRVAPEGWNGPYAGVQFAREPEVIARRIVRIVTRAYLAALALVALASVVALAVGRFVRAPVVEPEPLRRPGWRRVAPAAVAALVVSCLVICAYIAAAILERLPHVQDSVGYLFQAKTFALGRLWVPQPPLPDFFWHEFVVMDQGKWYSKYPPGFPMILAIGVLFGAPWLVNPVLAAFCVLLVYILGRDVAGPGTGLVAAAILLISPFFLFLSGEYMAHTAGLFFALLFAVAYLRHARTGGVGAAALAGVAFGMGFLVRPWTAILLALPFALDALLFLLRERRIPSGLLAIPLTALPFFLGWLAYNAALTGNPDKNTMEMWWAFDQLGVGPDKGIWGHTPGNAVYNMSRNLTELVRHAFGWPRVATLALAMVPFVAMRARRSDWLMLGGILSLVGGYMLWWADGIMYGPRFYFEQIGFLAVLSARGATEAPRLFAAAFAGLSGSRLADTAGRSIAALALCGFVVHDLVLYLPGQFPQHRGYNYVSRRSLDAVERAGYHHAVVLTHVGERHEWWNYGMVFPANSPLLDGDVIYARDLGPEENRKLRVLYPDRSFYRLLGTLLEPVPPEG